MDVVANPFEKNAGWPCEEEAAVAAELEAKRAERRRLAERLEAEQRRGFWARLFGGSGE